MLHGFTDEQCSRDYTMSANFFCKVNMNQCTTSCVIPKTTFILTNTKMLECNTSLAVVKTHFHAEFKQLEIKFM